MSNVGSQGELVSRRNELSQVGRRFGEKTKVAAVVGSVGGSVQGSGAHKRVRFGSVEPAILAILKQLEPLATVLTLATCMLICRIPFTLTYGTIALLAFI